MSDLISNAKASNDPRSGLPKYVPPRRTGAAIQPAAPVPDDTAQPAPTAEIPVPTTDEEQKLQDSLIESAEDATEARATALEQAPESFNVDSSSPVVQGASLGMSAPTGEAQRPAGQNPFDAINQQEAAKQQESAQQLQAEFVNAPSYQLQYDYKPPFMEQWEEQNNLIEDVFSKQNWSQNQLIGNGSRPTSQEQLSEAIRRGAPIPPTSDVPIGGAMGAGDKSQGVTAQPSGWSGWWQQLQGIGNVVKEAAQLTSPLGYVVDAIRGESPAARFEREKRELGKAGLGFLESMQPAKGTTKSDGVTISDYRIDPAAGYFGEMGTGIGGAALYTLNAVQSLVSASIYSLTDAGLAVSAAVTGNDPAGLLTNDAYKVPFYRYRQALSGLDLGFTNDNKLGDVTNRYLGTINPEAKNGEWWGGLGLGLTLDVLTGGVDDLVWDGGRKVLNSLAGKAAGEGLNSVDVLARSAQNFGVVRPKDPEWYTKLVESSRRSTTPQNVPAHNAPTPDTPFMAGQRLPTQADIDDVSDDLWARPLEPTPYRALALPSPGGPIGFLPPARVQEVQPIVKPRAPLGGNTSLFSSPEYVHSEVIQLGGNVLKINQQYPSQMQIALVTDPAPHITFRRVPANEPLPQFFRPTDVVIDPPGSLAVIPDQPNQWQLYRSPRMDARLDGLQDGSYNLSYYVDGVERRHGASVPIKDFGRLRDSFRALVGELPEGTIIRAGSSGDTTSELASKSRFYQRFGGFTPVPGTTLGEVGSIEFVVGRNKVPGSTPSVGGDVPAAYQTVDVPYKVVYDELPQGVDILPSSSKELKAGAQPPRITGAPDAKQLPAAKAKANEDVLPDDDDLPQLGELFNDADRIGNKYQTPEEIESFQRQYSEAVAEVEDLTPQGRIEDSADFSKTGRGRQVVDPQRVKAQGQTQFRGKTLAQRLQEMRAKRQVVEQPQAIKKQRPLRELVTLNKTELLSGSWVNADEFFDALGYSRDDLSIRRALSDSPYDEDELFFSGGGTVNINDEWANKTPEQIRATLDALLDSYETKVRKQADVGLAEAEEALTSNGHINEFTWEGNRTEAYRENNLSSVENVEANSAVRRALTRLTDSLLNKTHGYKQRHKTAEIHRILQSDELSTAAIQERLDNGVLAGVFVYGKDHNGALQPRHIFRDILVAELSGKLTPDTVLLAGHGSGYIGSGSWHTELMDGTPVLWSDIADMITQPGTPCVILSCSLDRAAYAGLVTTYISKPAPFEEDLISRYGRVPRDILASDAVGGSATAVYKPKLETVLRLNADRLEQGLPIGPQEIKSNIPPNSQVINWRDGLTKRYAIRHPLSDENGEWTTIQYSELVEYGKDLVFIDGTNQIGNRLAGVAEFLDNNLSFYAPEIVERADGTYIVKDGRHRIAQIAEYNDEIPVVLSRETPAQLTNTTQDGIDRIRKSPNKRAQKLADKLQELKDNNDADIQNAAGIFATAQAATNIAKRTAEQLDEATANVDVLAKEEAPPTTRMRTRAERNAELNSMKEKVKGAALNILNAADATSQIFNNGADALETLEKQAAKEAEEIREVLIREAVDEGVQLLEPSGAMVAVSSEVREQERLIKRLERRISSLLDARNKTDNRTKRLEYDKERNQITNDLRDAKEALELMKGDFNVMAAEAFEEAAPVIKPADLRPGMSVVDYLRATAQSVQGKDVAVVRRSNAKLTKLAQFLTGPDGKPLINPTRKSPLKTSEVQKLQEMYGELFAYNGKEIPDDILHPQARVEVQPEVPGVQPQVTQFLEKPVVTPQLPPAAPAEPAMRVYTDPSYIDPRLKSAEYTPDSIKGKAEAAKVRQEARARLDKATKALAKAQIKGDPEGIMKASAEFDALVAELEEIPEIAVDVFNTRAPKELKANTTKAKEDVLKLQKEEQKVVEHGKALQELDVKLDELTQQMQADAERLNALNHRARGVTADEQMTRQMMGEPDQRTIQAQPKDDRPSLGDEAKKRHEQISNVLGKDFLAGMNNLWDTISDTDKTAIEALTGGERYPDVFDIAEFYTGVKADRTPKKSGTSRAERIQSQLSQDLRMDNYFKSLPKSLRNKADKLAASRDEAVNIYHVIEVARKKAGDKVRNIAKTLRDETETQKKATARILGAAAKMSDNYDNLVDEAATAARAALNEDATKSLGWEAKQKNTGLLSENTTSLASAMNGRTWYHGTRYVIDDLSHVSPNIGASSNADLGAGLYLTADPLMGVEYARASVTSAQSNVVHRALADSGQLHEAVVQLDHVIDASSPIPEAVRNTVKDILNLMGVGEDFVDMRTINKIHRQLKDKKVGDIWMTVRKALTDDGYAVSEIKWQEFQSQLATYFKSEGIDGIYRKSDYLGEDLLIFDDNTFLPVRTASITEGIGDGSALDARLARHHIEALMHAEYKNEVTEAMELQARLAVEGESLQNVLKLYTDELQKGSDAVKATAQYQRQIQEEAIKHSRELRDKNLKRSDAATKAQMKKYIDKAQLDNDSPCL